MNQGLLHRPGLMDVKCSGWFSLQQGARTHPYIILDALLHHYPITTPSQTNSGKILACERVASSLYDYKVGPIGK